MQGFQVFSGLRLQSSVQGFVVFQFQLAVEPLNIRRARRILGRFQCFGPTPWAVLALPFATVISTRAIRTGLRDLLQHNHMKV